MTMFLESQFAISLTVTLLHFIWQAALIGSVHLFLLRSGFARTARARYEMALFGMIAVVVSPVVTFMTIYQTSSSFHSSRPVALASDAVSPASTGDSTLSSHAGGASVSHANERWNLQLAAPYLLTLWMCGVVASLVRITIGLTQVMSLNSRRRRVSVSLQIRTRQIARNLGLQSARIFGTLQLDGAAVVGFFRPAVLIPMSWLSSLPTDVLEAVIAHELSHIKRHDNLVNLFQRLVETVFFYLPVVWWLSDQIRMERELCCDEMAIAATQQRHIYATALEHIGSMQQRRRIPLTTSFHGDKRMNLLTRVKNVLNVPQARPEPESAWVLGFAAATIPVLLVGTLAMSSTASAQEGKPSAERGLVRSGEGERGLSASPESGMKRPGAGVGEGERSVEGGRPEGDDHPRGELGKSAEGQQPQSGFAAFQLSPQWQTAKEGRIFKVYDDNNDQKVSLAEWLGATNGASNAARQKAQTERYVAADKNQDKQLDPAEFIYWYLEGRYEGTKRAPARGGEGTMMAPRDGEGGVSRGPRDGEGVLRGPRDGEGSPRGPRDGEAGVRGPRDGEGAPRGPRDVEGGFKGKAEG